MNKKKNACMSIICEEWEACCSRICSNDLVRIPILLLLLFVDGQRTVATPRYGHFLFLLPPAWLFLLGLFLFFLFFAHPLHGECMSENVWETCVNVYVFGRKNLCEFFELSTCCCRNGSRMSLGRQVKVGEL